MSAATDLEPAEFLSRFGLTEFRPGQKDVIRAVLEGRDCLCIMPTGGGKSLCFQLPAVMRPGLVLVISPLIALMKDQVDSLQRQGIHATFINSSLEVSEQHQRLGQIAAGQVDLVYVAPERLRSSRFLETLQHVSVQLLAVDEAHCISEWGHDFRPDYTRIGRFREKMGWPQTIALTATATPDVRRDVLEQLRLRSAESFITGFARPNLRFECYEPDSTRDKNEYLLSLIQETAGAVLVYAATRKRCEELVEFLGEKLDRRCGMYHAGLLPEDRRRVQDEFMSGRVPVIVATNAFGMGIDKRDLRLVVHYNMPGTLEAYYQEAGRAGRDGHPARCVLLFSYSDRYVQEFFIENAYPAREVVKQVFEYLCGCEEDPIELTLQQIRDALGVTMTNEGIGTCEQVLEKCGAIERLDSQQNQASVKIDSTLPTLVDLLPKEAKTQRRVLRALEELVGDARGEWVFFPPGRLAAAVDLGREPLNRALRELQKLDAFDYVPPFRGRAIHVLKRRTPFHKLEIDFAEMARRKAFDLEKLERVIQFAQTRRCRQLEILEYFGDPHRKACQICDNCRPDAPAAGAPTTPAKLAGDQAVVEAVRIVLSGAARAKERIGKELLAMMLAGSSSARISKLRLDKLSTYGLLGELRQADVSELIDAVIEARLLSYVDLDRFRAVLTLTELGKQVMRGSEPLPSRFDVARRLAERLRSRTPTEKKTNPAHSANPSSSANKSHDASSAANAPEVPIPDPPETHDRDADAAQRTYYWTWRLLADGYSAEECLAIRSLDESTFLEHLTSAAREGLEVRLEWVFTRDQQVELSAQSSVLPTGLQPQHVALFQAIRG